MFCMFICECGKWLTILLSGSESAKWDMLENEEGNILAQYRF